MADANSLFDILQEVRTDVFKGQQYIGSDKHKAYVHLGEALGALDAVLMLRPKENAYIADLRRYDN